MGAIIDARSYDIFSDRLPIPLQQCKNPSNIVSIHRKVEQFLGFRPTGSKFGNFHRGRCVGINLYCGILALNDSENANGQTNGAMERTCQTKCRFDSCSIYVNFGILLREYYLWLWNGPLLTVFACLNGCLPFSVFDGKQSAGGNCGEYSMGCLPIFVKTKCLYLLLLFYQLRFGNRMDREI